MTVQNAKIFKFQALKLFDYITWDQLVSIRAAGSAVFNFSPELAEQMSGPSFYPIETEVSTIATEGTLNIGEYGSDIMKALMDADITEINPGATGAIDSPRNLKGSLFMLAGDGIVSVALSTIPMDIKSGLYRIRIANTTTGLAEVIAISSPDLVPSDYDNFLDSLVTTVTIADGASLDLGNGVTATCASTVDLSTFEVGDSFLLRVTAPGSEAYTARLGQVGQAIPKVRAVCLSRTMSDGRWFELVAQNCIFPGVNLNFGDEFAANEITGKMIFDPTLQYVADIAAYKR